MFKRSHKESCGRFEYVVLCSFAGEGLSAEHAFALREIILQAEPIDFYFLNPGTFNVFFQSGEKGSLAAQDLGQCLRHFATINSIPAFGVGIQVGLCLAELSSKGGFSYPPVGETVSSAMSKASIEAKNAL